METVEVNTFIECNTNAELEKFALLCRRYSRLIPSLGEFFFFSARLFAYGAWRAKCRRPVDGKILTLLLSELRL